MLKRLMTWMFALCTSWAIAAVDINKANEAELLEIKGIGAATATRILDARQQEPFKSWDDVMLRVKGIAATTASKLSQQGLTVNGQAYKASATPTKNTPNPSEKSAKPAQATGKKSEKS